MLLLTSCTLLNAQDKFNIRGVLPWHNFLSGPTSWNLDDYKEYLDKCQKEGINFIGFHNYTGGGERYSTYVEPMIKIEYKNILPLADLGNSQSPRWGYLPMNVADFVFDTDKAFDLPETAVAFGSDASILSQTNEEHYTRTQDLMRNVLKMAHDRGMKMAMGFEFGVLPPEYFSLNVEGDCFYWAGESNMVPNPRNQIAIELHYAAIDNILETYPNIDYIWLWLNEHSFMSVDTKKALQNKDFAEAYKQYENVFREATDESSRFVGVWALTYMQLTYDYLKSKNSNTKLILGGWGGGHQLPSLLKGLDRALPKDVIFSCLNPDLGKSPQPDFLTEIAKNRTTWTVPWIEGDHQLWHFQPRVDMMREHVKLASEQNLDGVITIHWRTEEPRFNFKTFAHFASNRKSDLSVEQLYMKYLSEEFGTDAAKKLTPILTKMDVDQIQWNVPSPEFYAYTPDWGKLDENNVILRKALIENAETALPKIKNKSQQENLERFIAMFRFELLLGEVSDAMLPAFNLKKAELQSGKKHNAAEYREVYNKLQSAPMKAMFDTYVKRVNSQGELGVLSSMNQRIWREYSDLKIFLEKKMER